MQVLRFWVACRISSNPSQITGEETLGLKPVDDEGYNMHGMVPLPPIITPQEQLIIYSRFLIPLSAKIVSHLDQYLKETNPETGYTSYLGLFILLHSCSMLTRRNAEYAREIGRKVRTTTREARQQLTILPLARERTSTRRASSPCTAEPSPCWHTFTQTDGPGSLICQRCSSTWMRHR